MIKKDMNITGKAKNVMKTPDKFFASIKNEKGFKPSFIYLAVILLISSVLNYFVLWTPLVGGFSVFPNYMGFSMIIVLWIVPLILSFITYGFLHLFIILFGGKGGYENTYKAGVYSSTPSALFGWIAWILFKFGSSGMVIGGLLFAVITIWALYLLVKGLSMLHELSKARSVLAIIVLILVIIIIAAVFAALAVLALILGNPNAMPAA